MQKSCAVLTKFSPLELSRLNAASSLSQNTRSAFIRDAVAKAVANALERASLESPK